MPVNQIQLVELNAILDFRLSALAIIDRAATEELLISRKYWGRESDNFELLTNGKIKNADFERVHSTDSAELLSGALLTNLMEELSKQAKGLRRTKLHPEPTGDIVYHINTSPYEFNSKSRKTLLEALHWHFGPGIKVELVYLSENHLSPSELNAVYASYISYHAMDKWWARWHKQVTDNPIPEFTIIFPSKFEPGKEENISDWHAAGYSKEFTLASQLAGQSAQFLMLDFLTIDPLPLIAFSATYPELPRKD